MGILFKKIFTTRNDFLEKYPILMKKSRKASKFQNFPIKYFKNWNTRIKTHFGEVFETWGFWNVKNLCLLECITNAKKFSTYSTYLRTPHSNNTLFLFLQTQYLQYAAPKKPTQPIKTTLKINSNFISIYTETR